MKIKSSFLRGKCQVNKGDVVLHPTRGFATVVDEDDGSCQLIFHNKKYTSYGWYDAFNLDIIKLTKKDLTKVK